LEEILRMINFMSDLGKKRGFWAGTEAQSIVNEKIIK
jgi:hypothetical protein